MKISKKKLWEGLPSLVKESVSNVLRFVPPEVLLGKKFRSNLNFINQSQWWSKEQIQSYQLEHLKKICSIANRETVFYKKVFSDIGFKVEDLRDLKDIQKIPLIDRNTLIMHLTEMCATNLTGESKDYITTGGTSGEPLRFYINSDRSYTEYPYLVSSWMRTGYKLDTPFAVFRGKTVAENRSGLRHAYDPLFRHHIYSNFHMTDENMHRYLKHIESLGTCYLHVYPSAIDALARAIRRGVAAAPRNIKGIIAESEIVYPEQRKLVEEVFGCRYFSCYGHTEKLVAASECEHSSDYHVWPTYGFFELVDSNGESVTTPGQRGEIVGTGFINTVLPFIRYRTGDFATYIGERCEKCGREHTLIRDIVGHRIQETLIGDSNEQISWTALNMHDDTFDNVIRFQFMQDTPGVALLKILPAPGYNESDQERILKNLGKKLESRIKIKISLVDEIPLSGRGKAIYVDQKISY